MAFQRGIDGSEPTRSDRVSSTRVFRDQRRSARSTHMASATLACPGCDAPVALPAPTMTPGQPLACGFCGRTGLLRDFLSLAVPTRPMRVEVHVRRVVS